MKRKTFLKTALMGSFVQIGKQNLFKKRDRVNKPVVVSTWQNQPANAAAWEILTGGGTALDAVEAGAMVPEGDPEDHSVGYGGYPDRTGKVTLDACIMNEEARCGSVAFLEHIRHPVAVARKVMESSPHVMMAGEDALDFALEQGFTREDLLTEEARKFWENWQDDPEFPITDMGKYRNHDTIGILALDQNGNLSGACTTSGTAMKMHGRVGDSPIIGAGLFVDPKTGAAAATGVGEEVIRIAGSHLVVELMSRGIDPEEACRQAVQRIVRTNGGQTDDQVGFLALNRNGEYGGYAVQTGYSYSVRDPRDDLVVISESWFS